MQEQINGLKKSFTKLENDYADIVYENRRLKWIEELQSNQIKEKDQAIAQLTARNKLLESEIQRMELLIDERIDE